MIRWKSSLTTAAGTGGAVLLALASAAHADVKDGVDAWSAGDFAKAVAEWRDPAAKGDPDALFNLAQAYRLGRGVPVDTKQAATLYAQAAARGHLKAADNYGLLLFQEGRREEAMPYIAAAAERGDPRAQYLLGVAHFNGDLAAKDWVRSYALLTLANGARLPQAAATIKEMDEFVPLAQRQEAQALAAHMRSQADARRTVQMAAEDLDESPAIAGAVIAQNPPAATRSAATPSRDDKANSRESGPWKLQLGAFSVPSNVDRAWAQVAGSAALDGKVKQTAIEGRLTRLLAAGWADRAAAQSACTALKAGGHACLVTR